MRVYVNPCLSSNIAPLVNRNIKTFLLIHVQIPPQYICISIKRKYSNSDVIIANAANEMYLRETNISQYRIKKP